MHELSIAENIVEIASEEALKNNAKFVEEIILEIGVFSGVVIEALEFAMKSAIKSSLLKDSRITIIAVEGLAKCENCQHEFTSDSYFNNCPACGDFKTSILKGKELKIKSLILNTD